MKNYKKIFCIFIAISLLHLLGCSHKSIEKEEQKTKRVLTSQEIEYLKERSLDYFINGASLDAKGAYAEAILEYYEALQRFPNATIYYAISKDYLILNKITRAIETAYEAVKMEPKNITYRNHLAYLFYNNNQIELAIKEHENILSIDSTYINSMFAIAQILKQTNPNKSLEYYEKILLLDEAQLQALYESAQLYYSLMRFDQAASKYKIITDCEPQNVAAKKYLALSYYNGGRINEAKNTLESLLQNDSLDVDAIALLGEICLDENNYEKSKMYFNKLKYADIKDDEYKLRIAIAYYRIAQNDSTVINSTIQLFDTLKIKMPKDWRPVWYIGLLYSMQNNDSLALNYLEQATNIEGSTSDALSSFGFYLLSHNYFNKLLKISEKYIEQNPKDFRFYMLKGLALNKLEKKDKAVLELEKALELNPKDINIITTLANIFTEINQNDKAIKLFIEGLKYFPDSPLLLNNYAYTLAEQGSELEKALKMSKIAIEKEPENAAYLDTYGWILCKLEKYEEALDYINKSVKIDPENSVLLDHLGDVYKKLNMKDQAKEAWNKALQKDPNNQTIINKIKEN